LVSPYVREPGADQLLTKLPAGLAERTVAVEHQRLALVPAHQTLDRGDRLGRRSVNVPRARNVADHELRAAPGIQDEGAAVGWMRRTSSVLTSGVFWFGSASVA